ncbi:MAG: TolC family protein [Giesbergeria sp.]
MGRPRQRLGQRQLDRTDASTCRSSPASTPPTRSAPPKPGPRSRAPRRDNVRQQVALDVWEAYQSLSTATQTMRTSADLLASAEHSERVALGRYKAGVGNILDVLNAQSALANARLQRIQATLDWHVSRATLARADRRPRQHAAARRSARQKARESMKPLAQPPSPSSLVALAAGGVLLVSPEQRRSRSNSATSCSPSNRGDVTPDGLGQRHAQPGGAGQCRHAGLRAR